MSDCQRNFCPCDICENERKRNRKAWGLIEQMTLCRERKMGGVMTGTSYDNFVIWALRQASELFAEKESTT